jgi:hypothetical protein
MLPTEPPHAASASTPPMKILGVVATESDEAVRDRRITVVDARGRRFDAVTDARGGFALDEVVTPYDLVVAATAGADSKSGATVFLGLKRADPYVELLERAATWGEESGVNPSPVVIAPQIVRAAIPADSCPKGGGTIFLVTTSMAGAGSATVRCDGSGRRSSPTESESPLSEAAIGIDVSHAFRSADSGMVDVHVLISNEARTTFAYARKRETTTAQPGTTTDIGVIEPIPPVGSSSTLVLGAEEGDRSGWSWTTEVVLEADGVSRGVGAEPQTQKREGLGFVFATSTRPYEAMNVPLLPGLVVRTTVSATHPRFDGRGQSGAHQSLRAWSGPSWLGSIPPLLSMPRAPEMVRPAPGSIFSRHGQGFAWRTSDGEGPSGLVKMTVTDRARGGAVRYTVMTEGSEVTLAKLSTLGLSGSLAVGDHTLDLATTPSAAVDHVCSPDPRLRRAEVEEMFTGASTHFRFGFQVVP